MRGIVVKALRLEAHRQQLPLKKLKRGFQQLNWRQRTAYRAILRIHDAVDGLKRESGDG